MKSPEKILKQAVERITSAINKENLPPQKAVTKIAEEMNLNSNLIKRASEVINVALTYNHFKNNPDSKDADFPIVDAAKIAAELYGPELPHKKVAVFSGVDIDEEVPDFNKFSTRANIKAAYVQLKKESLAPTENVKSLRGRWDDLSTSRLDFEQELLNAKVAQHDAQDKMYGSLMSLVNQFKKDASYRTSFEEFESQAYALHRERAIPYLDFIHKTAELKEKRGVHDPKYRLFDECPEVLTFNKFLKAASAWNSTSAAVHEKKAQMEEFLQGVESLRKQLGDNLNATEAPVEKKAEQIEEEEAKFVDPVMERVKLKTSFAEAWEKTSSVLDGTIGGFLGGLTSEAKNNIANISRSPSPALPSFTPKDNLERKLMLQELIVTDPILSGHDPKKVIDAYQQFIRIAPELSKEKEIVRAELRARTSSQAMGVFDAKQLIDTNTDFMKQKLIQEGTINPQAKPVDPTK